MSRQDKSSSEDGSDSDEGRKRACTVSTPEQVRRDYVDFHTLEKVRVICRFRPSNSDELQKEREMGLKQINPMIDGQAVSLTRGLSRERQTGMKHFFLDNVLDSKSSQNRCFRVIGFPMVQSVLAGYNATVLTYGQAGSGKTYTMFGYDGSNSSPTQVGIIQRAAALLFKSLAQS